MCDVSMYGCMSIRDIVSTAGGAYIAFYNAHQALCRYGTQYASAPAVHFTSRKRVVSGDFDAVILHIEPSTLAGSQGISWVVM